MRIAFGIEYDGTGTLGWQAQRHGPSVQQAVESVKESAKDSAQDMRSTARESTEAVRREATSR